MSTERCSDNLMRSAPKENKLANKRCFQFFNNFEESKGAECGVRFEHEAVSMIVVPIRNFLI